MGTVTGTSPVLAKGPVQLEYCFAYVSGTGLVIYRSADHFSSLLTYPNAATSAVVAAGADDDQCGAVKMMCAGNKLSVVVPESGSLAEYLSDYDGYTWAAV